MGVFADKAVALGIANPPAAADACNYNHEGEDMVMFCAGVVGLDRTVLVGVCMCCHRLGVAMAPVCDNDELVRMRSDLADDVVGHLAPTPAAMWDPGHGCAMLKAPLTLPQQLLLRLRNAE